jgi:hypothetical protein
MTEGSSLREKLKEQEDKLAEMSNKSREYEALANKEIWGLENKIDDDNQREHDNLIVLCIDLSMSNDNNKKTNDLVKAMFDKVEEENNGGADTLLSFIIHGITFYNSGQGYSAFGHGTKMYDVDAARQLYERLPLEPGSYQWPSYSSAMGKLGKLHRRAKLKFPELKTVKVYWIGDGYRSKGYWDNGDENYVELKGTVRFWSFCLSNHSRADCYFGSMESGCHHHAQGFDGKCILPIG